MIHLGCKQVAECDSSEIQRHHDRLQARRRLSVRKFQIRDRDDDFGGGDEDISQHLPTGVRLQPGSELRFNPRGNQERKDREEETNTHFPQRSEAEDSI